MESGKEKPAIKITAQDLQLLQRMQLEADVYLYKRNLEKQGDKPSFDEAAVRTDYHLVRGYGTYLVKRPVRTE